MTQYSRSALIAQVNSDFPDNTTRSITAAQLRQYLINDINSEWNILDNGAMGTLLVDSTDTTPDYLSNKVTSTGNTLTWTVTSPSGNAKLNGEVAASIITEINNATTAITTIEGEITTINGTISTLAGDVTAIQTDITTINTNLSSLNTEVGTINTTIAPLTLTWTSYATGGLYASGVTDIGGSIHIGKYSTADTSGNVFSEGVVTVPTISSGVSAPILVLPSGLRPSATIYIQAALQDSGGNPIPAILYLFSNGTLEVKQTTGTLTNAILSLHFSFNTN